MRPILETLGIMLLTFVIFLSVFVVANGAGSKEPPTRPINPDLVGTYWTDGVVQVNNRLVYCMYTTWGRAAVYCTQVQQ